MKKIVSVLFIIVMCITLLAGLMSCSSKHPIAQFEEKMKKADSYQIAMIMSNIPLLGTLTMTVKVDGNIQYSPSFLNNQEEYIEIVGNEKYKYTKSYSGKWTKTKETSTNEVKGILDENSMKELFNPANYEKVNGEENIYKQKSDVIFDEYEDVQITIREDSCTIEMNSNSSGITLGVKMVISKLGEIELKLPEVD